MTRVVGRFHCRLLHIVRQHTFCAAARKHVNRMCLAADVPLVESGSAGYLGQVTVIKKVGDLPVCVVSVSVSFC